jgi:hypothetical protein
VCAFLERTQVGQGAKVTGLRLTPSGALWAHSDDGLEDGSGTLPGSSKADTPENPLSLSPFQYIEVGMVMIRGKGVPSYTRMIGVSCGPSGTAGEARIRTYPDNRVHLGACDLYKRGHHLR